MKFSITKASDSDYLEIIEINTLEDLIEFSKNEGGTIIFSEYSIIIYDDYVE